MGLLLKPGAPLLLLVLFLVCFGWQDVKLSRAEASRPLSFMPQQRYSENFAGQLLGVVCKCCVEGPAEGEQHCASTWNGGPCSNLHCLPWKLQH